MGPKEFEALRGRLDEREIPYRGPDLGVRNSVYVRDPDGLQVELLSAALLDMDFD